jgi:repressor LexA
VSATMKTAVATELTEQQAAILDFIAEHIDLFGWAPSVREIGGHVGLRSTSTVHHHLRRLEELGLIVRGSRQSRATSVGRAAA